jgi:hypothetical protein
MSGGLKRVRCGHRFWSVHEADWTFFACEFGIVTAEHATGNKNGVLFAICERLYDLADNFKFLSQSTETLRQDWRKRNQATTVVLPRMRNADLFWYVRPGPKVRVIRVGTVTPGRPAYAESAALGWLGTAMGRPFGHDPEE